MLQLETAPEEFQALLLTQHLVFCLPFRSRKKPAAEGMFNRRCLIVLYLSGYLELTSTDVRACRFTLVCLALMDSGSPVHYR